MPTLRFEALAKVNFGLRILYRRPDGFHELRTIFQTISLADQIELEYRRGRAGATVEMTCNRADLAGADNLASRAALRLLEANGSGGRVRLHLEKRIPVGAGLGGGSGDAAAVLLALGSVLRPPPGWLLIRRLAAELGSDVPFFLLGGRALGIGRGTEIYPLADEPAQWILVAAPPIHVSTAEAYRRLGASLTTGSQEDKIDRFCSSVCAPERKAAGGAPKGTVFGFDPGLAQAFQAGPENDFEPVVFRMHPELETLKERLQRLGACPALLSGSGSALFGVFVDRRQALRARDSLDLADGRCFVVRTVSRLVYQARWRKWLSGAKPAQ